MQVRVCHCNPRRTGLRRALLAAAVLAALLLLGPGGPGRAPHAHADVPVSGAGVYSLDQPAYSVVEGEVVFVRVLRTQGAVLTADVVVTLRVEEGVEGFDYPLETITQLATFKKDTNPTEMTVGFQTLNQGRVHNKTIRVKLLSVSGGGQVGALNIAPVTVIGFGVPRVESISPKSGGPGTVITVHGANFQTPPGRTMFDVGFLDTFTPEPPSLLAGDIPGAAPPWMAAAGYTVHSPTLMTVVVPDLSLVPSPRQYHLRVRIKITAPPAPDDFSRSPAVAADIFTFTTGPTVTSVLPSQGPSTGGQVVTIRGTGFSPAACPAQVLFGAVPASLAPPTSLAPGCAPVSTTEFRIASPASSPGAVDVTVCFAICSPATTESRFTYTGGPVITAIAPSSGPTTGGTAVTITGTGFLNVLCPSTGPTGVRFGGLSAACTVL